jgi:hypothetical protein
VTCELFKRIEALRAELYRAAAGCGGNRGKGSVLALSTELDRYLVLATRELSGLR